MIKIIALIILQAFASIAFASDTTAVVTLSHDSTVYANRGICSAKFSYEIDEYIDQVYSLEISLVAKDLKNKVVFSEKISQLTSDMTSVGGRVYGEFFLEDEAICESKNWSIEIASARFTFKDGHVSKDLIKSKQIVGSTFKPMPIKTRK